MPILNKSKTLNDKIPPLLDSLCYKTLEQWKTPPPESLKTQKQPRFNAVYSVALLNWTLAENPLAFTVIDRAVA